MAAGDTRKVLLENTDGEYLIPYTEVASSNTVGRVKPDGTSTTVDANGVISVASAIQSGAAAGATAVQPSGVGNAEIEIQKNGTKVDSFTTNQSGSKKTINITVPTSAADVSALPASTKYGASITVSLNTTDYKLTTTLKDQDGNTLGTAQVVDFPIESVVVNGSYDSTNQKIVLTLQNGNTIDIPVGALISGLQSEITSSNKLDADLVDDSTSTNKFVTASDKTNWDGKVTANTAITGATKCKITYDSKGLVTAGSDLASSDITTALGYTPYNSSNPNSYQENIIETVKVNGTALTPSSKEVDITVPTETTVSGWGFTKNTGTVTSVNNISPVNGNVSLTIPTVNDATLTITQGGTTKGTFTANASNNVTIDLDAGGGSVSVDETTISRNSSQELQAVGLINKNENVSAVSPLGVWTGTKQQWEQGSSITWYNWMKQPTKSVDSTTVSGNTWALVYGGGTYTVPLGNTTTVAYSTDGSSWSTATLPISKYWSTTAYGNGTFVAIGGDTVIYSSDGQSWSTATNSNLGTDNSVCFGNGKFVIVGWDGKASYSTDGQSWTGVTIPNRYYSRVVYGDGKFVAISQNSGYSLVSTNGIDWTEYSNLATRPYSRIAYGNGVFVATSIYGHFAYSSDGINWTELTRQYSTTWNIAFGSGIFVACALDSLGYVLVSSDGINWHQENLPQNFEAKGLTYGDGKFISFNGSGNILTITISNDSVFTAEEIPTLSSQIYSAPNVVSTLTVDSIQSGYMILSDNNNYLYNSDGNQTTYTSIGTLHPNWLCNITDDTDATATLLAAVYPVGSIYITTTSTCPLTNLINGSTWELVSSGRVLQGADAGHAAGTTIAAGLPNVKAQLGGYFQGTSGSQPTGIQNVRLIDLESGKTGYTSTYVGSARKNTEIDMSISSSIYGASNTVQPPAYVVNIFRRTA